MTEVSGKWILLGEHAVVRGKPALVFPLQGKKLRLESTPLEEGGFSVNIPELESPMKRILEECERLTGKKIPPHKFDVHNEIPLKAGLGSSAALSVAVARWLGGLGFLTEDSFFSFALSLENLFHGSSSGLDVAAVLSGRPLRFRKGSSENLPLLWRPRFYLADSGLRSSTKEAVAKVASLGDTSLDGLMEEAVLIAEEALTKEDGFERLAKALHLGEKCFARWGLIPPEVRTLMEKLYAAGAAAVKPTGSGDGGFVLSLWKKEPDADTRLRFGLIQAY